MARQIPLQILRTTRANLNTQRDNSGLLQGELYFITDESKLAVGTAPNACVDVGAGGTQNYVRGATFVNAICLVLPVNNVKLRIHVDSTIVSSSIETIGGTGSIVLDVKRSGTSICGSSKPAISSGTEYVDTILTGWTTALSAGDVLTVSVDSVSGSFTYAALDLVLQPV